jgi:prephenate dehydrogenase
MRPDTLGVVGLGAVGGSLAWQATLAGVRRVIGYSPMPAEGVAAVRAGAISDVAPSVRFVFEHAELVVIAVPPAATLRLLEDAALHLRSGAVCTDVTSAKQAVGARAASVGLAQRFAGSHPMIALTGRGFASAEPAPFRGALVYVTPVGAEDTPAREIADFWATVLDAEPVVLDAADHDSVVAWTDHLPRAVASALARAACTDGPRGVTYGIEARAVTRPALAPVQTMRDVLLLNRNAVLGALDDFEGALGDLRAALREGDARRLESWLQDATSWRGRLSP